MHFGKTSYRANRLFDLTKPFQIRELSARLRALMRRPAQMVSEVLQGGDLELADLKHEVWKNGEQIKLFPQEFSLLEVLMGKPAMVHTT
ncbi:MAG: response regulator transcription factor [Candidatus Melainabacteria bacterium]|nr:response regulator transcription factor [Candidatus Melainabacteria bacterium]